MQKKDEQKLEVKPVFVRTANVRNFESMMRGLDLAAGEGRFGLVWGRAGRGKTRTARYYVAQNSGAIYMLALTVWRQSPSEMLRALAGHLGVKTPAKRINSLFVEVGERMARSRPTVFLDEPDKLRPVHFEILRDLVEYTGSAVVMIGEEELPGLMLKERRVWSRTFQQVEFQPFSLSDLAQYVTAAAQIRFTSPGAAEAMHRASEGDIRLVHRDTLNLVQILNARGVAEADEATVRAALRQSLSREEAAL